MHSVYIVTVTDKADFGKVIGHAAFRYYDSAAGWAEDVVRDYMVAHPSDLGDTYDRNIVQMAVR